MTDAVEIRMDHPARNALGSELVAWLESELDRAGERAVLLTGTGDAFCAGLNLEEVASLDGAGLESMLLAVDRLAARLFDHPAPTVALVNGHAIAGGCVLVQCCDHRVAVDSPTARIGLNEVALGACFPPRILSILRFRLPIEHQHELLLGASLYPPRRALELEMLDAVGEEPETKARAWLERTAAHPRATYAHTKRILQHGVTENSAEDERRFREEELPIWNSPELKQRVLAVLGK